MTSLSLGQSLTVPRIAANRPWNHTGLLLEMAKAYRFQVPDGDKWTDLIIRSDANGYESWVMRHAEQKRRVKAAKWFALVGAIGEDDRNAFVIGTWLEEYRPPATGELVCYENDWPNMYWNNHGSVRLVIDCIA